MSSPAEVQGCVTVCVHYQDSEHGPVLQSILTFPGTCIITLTKTWRQLKIGSKQDQ